MYFLPGVDIRGLDRRRYPIVAPTSPAIQPYANVRKWIERIKERESTRGLETMRLFRTGKCARRLPATAHSTSFQKVARQFEFNSLQQRVFSFRDSLLLWVKNAHLAGIRHPTSTGEPVSSVSNASFEDFSLFALWAVDLAHRWAWLRPRTAQRGFCDFEQQKDGCRSAVK